MSSPDLTEIEVRAVNEVLSTRHLAMGPHLDRFEERMVAYIGAHHAAGVSSGTAALHLSIIAAGIGEGDFVITTPFSFVASANCVLYERAVPLFVDVEEATWNIDPNLVAEATDDFSRGRDVDRWLPDALRGRRAEPTRLRALLPVHAFGEPADMDPLVETARVSNLVVIEDACEAIGAEYKGRRVGTLGDIGVFAFYPNKQMTTGEGGMIVTDRGDWDALVRSLRNQGRDVFNADLSHDRLGYNYRLDELSAVLGFAQIGRIEELLAKREQVARWYTERLADVEELQIRPRSWATTRTSWFVYVIRLAPEIDRAAVVAALDEQGIPSRAYFPPIHLQPFYAEKFGYRRGDYPVAEALGDSCLALPFSGVMTEEQVDYVCMELVAAIQRQPACSR